MVQKVFKKGKVKRILTYLLVFFSYLIGAFINVLHRFDLKELGQADEDRERNHRQNVGLAGSSNGVGSSMSIVVLHWVPIRKINFN